MSANIRSKKEVKNAIEMVRLDLYNKGEPCGAKVIREEMKSLKVMAVPSVSTINKVLQERYLTNKRTGFYKGDYCSPQFQNSFGK